MAVTKKPTTIDAEKFIDGAKADVEQQKRNDANKLKRNTVKPQDRESGQAVNRDTVKTVSSNNGKPLNLENVETDNRKTSEPHKRSNVKTSKKKKLTFYMDSEMYLQWKEYELKELRAGKKVSFQGVVEKYMARLLK
jgi:hypothetical protein